MKDATRGPLTRRSAAGTVSIGSGRLFASAAEGLWYRVSARRALSVRHRPPVGAPKARVLPVVESVRAWLTLKGGMKNARAQQRACVRYWENASTVCLMRFASKTIVAGA